MSSDEQSIKEDNNAVAREQQIKALLEEYKEMRNEIRSTYGQYFSLLFGIIFTGIFVTFYYAFEKNFLFLAVPYMITGWICLIIIIRLNIQHIAKYIKKIEIDINNKLGEDLLKYESNHAKLLWFSVKIKLIAVVPLALIVIVYLYSIYKGYIFLKCTNKIILGIAIRNYAMKYVLFTVALLFVLIPAFIFMPENAFKNNKT